MSSVDVKDKKTLLVPKGYWLPRYLQLQVSIDNFTFPNLPHVRVFREVLSAQMLNVWYIHLHLTPKTIHSWRQIGHALSIRDMISNSHLDICFDRLQTPASLVADRLDFATETHELRDWHVKFTHPQIRGKANKSKLQTKESMTS